jgi:magnesium transporter
MNFSTMPELDWRYGYPLAIVVMIAASFGLWWQFRRTRWLGGSPTGRRRR